MRRVAIMNGGTRRIGEAISVALCDMEYCVGVEVDGPPGFVSGGSSEPRTLNRELDDADEITPALAVQAR